MRVLILTEPRDFHAFAVAEALRQKGAEPVLWFGTDFPTRQAASVWVDEERFGLEISGLDIELRDARFGVVWNRRPADPVVPADLHPADHAAAARNCQHFVWSLWHLVAPDAVWINPISPIPSAILKPYQLRLAREVGLDIPPTLCSNNPRRIVEFLRAHPGETVFKHFHPSSWKTPDGVAMLYTAPVTEDDLPDDDLLQACPGIFQLRIPKAHELRVTFLGDRPYTARIRSQEEPRARQDWRRAHPAVVLEPDELPVEVAGKCRALMARLGLAFAAFDWIVTPEGRHVFLEINPMGQFLFVERRCPEIPLLDRFCDFLLERAGLAPEERGGPVRLADVWGPARQALETAIAEHQLKESKVVDEAAVAAEIDAEVEAELVAATGEAAP